MRKEGGIRSLSAKCDEYYCKASGVALFYAGMGRLEIFVLAFAFLAGCGAAFGESVFAPGTFAGDTRYDVKKVAYGAEGSSDSLLCWAASASNNLQLWQDNLANSGYVIPGGIPNGKTQEVYSTDIFYVFANSWEDEGSYSLIAYQWYMTGNYDTSIVEGMGASKPLPDPMSDGGYWAFLGYDMNDLAERIDLAGSISTPAQKTWLADALEMVFGNGFYASLTVNNWNNHSVTLTGYEYDPLSNDITGLWICDSDNPNTDSNFLVDISWNETLDSWILGEAHIDESEIVSDYSLEGWWVAGMEVFKAPMPVPESSIYAAIFGAFALAFAAFPRRK